MENKLIVGDLVWAKLHGYPWWPSIIYNEALTNTDAQQSKKEGFMLVSFFGDNSYKWLDPKNLLPFESNFSIYSNRCTSRLFVNAVNEAVYEVNHRAALGLTCPCLFFSSYRSANVEGFLEVEIDGYQSGGVYAVQQIEGFRKEFEPVQTLSFVQLLGLDSTNVDQDFNLSKEVARVLAFRKAKYAEVDEPYFLAFGVNPRGPTLTSIDQETALVEAPADDPLESESKDLKKPTIKYQYKKKKSLATTKDKSEATTTIHKVKRNLHHDSNTKTSQDHVPHKKRQMKVEVEKKTDFITTNDDKQVESLVTPTNCDTEKSNKKLQSSITSMPSKTCHMHKISPRGSKPIKKKQMYSPKMPLVLSSQKMRKKQEKSTIVKAPQEGPKMVLSMSFPPDIALPSVSELKAKFVIFGPLDVSGVCVSYHRSRCQVVFMNKSDAQKAYNHAVKFNKMFRQTNVFYRLHPYVSKPDLLEGNIKEANTSNKQITVTPQHAPVTSQQTDQTRMQVNQGSVDISEKMMYLLNECSRIVFELKQL